MLGKHKRISISEKFLGKNRKHCWTYEMQAGLQEDLIGKLLETVEFWCRGWLKTVLYNHYIKVRHKTSIYQTNDRHSDLANTSSVVSLYLVPIQQDPGPYCTADTARCQTQRGISTTSRLSITLTYRGHRLEYFENNFTIALAFSLCRPLHHGSTPKTTPRYFFGQNIDEVRKR